MRATLMGLAAAVIASVGLTFVEVGPASLYAQRQGGYDAPATVHDGLNALMGATVDGQQLVLLVDSQRQTMAAYHVDVGSGQISLRSVRNCRWDLEMEEFNGAEPSPEKIQALLRTRSLQPAR
jgi:hypothetical protein